MNKEELMKKYAGAINSLMNYMDMGIISRNFMLNKHRIELDELIKGDSI